MNRSGRLFIGLLCALTLSAVVGCTDLASDYGPSMLEVEMAYVPHRVVDANGKPLLRYRFLKPSTIEPGRKYPLILFLHGAGERGEDNFKQLTYGAAELLQYTRSQPAFVIIPQCPVGIWWDGKNRLKSESPPEGVVAPMQQVIALVDRIIAQQPIDRSRVYITGMSMGGFGTFTYVAARPDLFAAALPICGGGNPEWAKRYHSTSFWITHGRADPWVSVNESRDMVKSMAAAGVDVRYTEFPEVGHDAWTPTYASTGVLNWMFSQRRGVDPSADLNSKTSHSDRATP